MQPASISSHYSKLTSHFSDKLRLKLNCEAEGLQTGCEALHQALQVLEIESKNVKAIYRRAQAYINLVDLGLAELDIKKSLEIDPDNRDVKLEYNVLKEKMKEYNKNDVKFYGNMFAKLSTIDSKKTAPKVVEPMIIDSKA